MAAGGFPEEILEKLDALDREFFAYPDNLTELLPWTRSRPHPEEFGTLSEPDAA